MNIQNFKNKAGLILRIGLGITFIGIGYYILQAPEGWGGTIAPWIQNLLPFSLKATMISTAIFDILAGSLMILGIFTHIAALLGFLHLVMVILAIGINPIAVRDIGLGLAALSLALSTWPDRKI